MSRFLSLPLSKTLPLVVPRLLPLHMLLRQADPSEPLQLPPSLALSSEKLQDDGIYLAENGYEGYIYFAQRVPPELLKALLGGMAVILSGSSSSFNLLSFPCACGGTDRVLHCCCSPDYLMIG